MLYVCVDTQISVQLVGTNNVFIKPYVRFADNAQFINTYSYIDALYSWVSAIKT
jgi:hypothetical protein